MALDWISETGDAADCEMLACLCAAQQVLRKFVEAGPLIMDEWTAAAAERKAARDAAPPPEPKAAPPQEPKAAPAKDPGAAPRKVARVYAPQMLVISLRAAELMMELAPFLRELKLDLARRGIDWRKIETRTAADLLKQELGQEIGLDLEHLDQCSSDEMLGALSRIARWIRLAKKRTAKPPPEAPKEPEPEPEPPPPPAAAGPQAKPEDPPPKIDPRLRELLIQVWNRQTK